MFLSKVSGLIKIHQNQAHQNLGVSGFELLITDLLQGVAPEETPFNMCRENSVIDGDGCKCKSGYIDIVDTDIKQKNQFPKV